MPSVFTSCVCALALCVPLAISARAKRAPASHHRPSVVVAADFEHQETLFVAWDERLDEFFAAVVAAGHTVADVVVLLDIEQDDAPLLEALERGGVAEGDVTIVRTPIDSVWIRDYGPLLLRYSDGARALADAQYFGGGADDRIPRSLHELWLPGRPLIDLPVRMEGGNLLSDGAGRCITTTNTFRQMSAREHLLARRALRDALGCTTLVVLEPLEGEDTGHADMFALITERGRVLVGRFAPGEDDVNAALLDDNARALERAGFEVSRVAMPENDASRFRSYTNALPLNGVVLVPVYADSLTHELEALDTIAAAFPGRDVVPIESSEIISLGGAVHCAALGAAR